MEHARINVLRRPSAKEHSRVGKVAGVCMSQRRTDPKRNLGKGILKGDTELRERTETFIKRR